jgi:hypothetical protein
MLGCEFIVSGEGWWEELREGQPRRRAEVGVGVGDDELLESRGGGRGSGGALARLEEVSRRQKTGKNRFGQLLVGPAGWYPTWRGQRLLSGRPHASGFF